MPANDLKEFVAYAKANAAKLNQAHAGVGSVSHTTGILFDSQIGIKPTQVAYRGTGPALNDLVSGQVDFMTDQIVNVVEQVKAGTIKAYAIATAERSPALPDLPTVASQGYPGFEAKEWYGVVAPAGTPRAIVTRLNRELVRILNLPDVRSRLLDLGTEIVGDAPDQFGAFMKTELVKWAKVLKETGIRLE
jgi:tripartite-type tricarboxylate transporter receptor subunit TctC